MAKTMVTRTKVVTVATVLALNTETAEPFNYTQEVAGTFKADDKLLKVVKSMNDTDEIVSVKIVSKEEKEVLYGMEEDVFIKHATILPPRKKYNQEVDDNDNILPA